MSASVNATAPPQFVRAFYLAIWVITLALAFTFVPIDDGLRHVGLAFGPERSWGEVYPFSQFATFAEYDPWGGYDLALRGLASVLDWLPIDRSMQQFLALKLLAVGFVASLLALCLRRARVAATVVDGPALLLAVLVTGGALALPLFRMGTIRPFAFGTFLVLYTVGQRGFLRGFLPAGALCFLYPYLAWMYTGPVVVAHAIRGSRSLASGALVATLLWAVFQPAAFWGLVLETVRSDAVRANLHIKISEFSPMAEQLSLVVLLVLAGLWLWPRLSPGARRLRVEHIVVLLFVPISIKYMRYFVDIWLPLLFVAHGAYFLRELHEPFSREIQRWRNVLAAAEPATKECDVPATLQAEGSGRTMRTVLAVGYVVVVGMLIFSVSRQQGVLAADRARLQKVPLGSLALTDFNLQYRILYNRPDLSLVPSCEIGSVIEPVHEAYLAYMNQGNVCELAEATGAGYLIEARGLYLDPRSGTCLQLLGEDDAMRVWKIAGLGR